MTDTFVGELCDQFLICRLCSNDYKRPKTLSCLHTFCEACLEMHYEMEEQDRPYRFLMYSRALSCPICRARTELPTGGIHRLPDNFLVANLGEVINRRKPHGGGTMCEICKVTRSKTSQGRWDGWDGELNDKEDSSNSKRTAVTKCLDCVKMLCQTCADLHRQTKVTQQHTLYYLEVHKDIECKIHENETLKFYCEECQTCICVLCTFNEHHDHDVSTMAAAGEKHRETFEKLMQDCSKKSMLLRDQLETIDKFESEILKAESSIRDTAIETIAALRRKEKALMEELRNCVGERALHFITKKENLQETLRDTEQASSMTELLLKGTSIELLLVKKEMQEKLDTILSSRTENIPESLTREMKFSTKEYHDMVQEYMNSGKYIFKLNNETDEQVITKRSELKTSEVQTDIAERRQLQNATMQTDLPHLVDISIGPDTQMMLENDETESVLDDAEVTTNRRPVNTEEGVSARTPVEPMSELAPMSPVQLISPIEYITPMSMDSELPTGGDTSLTEAFSNKAKQNDSSNSSSTASRSNLVQIWKNSVKRRASIAASQDSSPTTPPSTPSGAVRSLKEAFGSENLRVDSELDGSVGAPVTAKLIKSPQQGKTIMVSIGTEMEQLKLKDSSTGTPTVSYHDKETGTPHIHTTSKFVSTDNLGMVDKCTMTAADVTAAYRNVAASRRLVTVSRGTCTPRAMFPLDRATSPVIWSFDDDNDAEQSEAKPSTHLAVPHLQVNSTMKQLSINPSTSIQVANSQQTIDTSQQVQHNQNQVINTGQQVQNNQNHAQLLSLSMQPSQRITATQQLASNQHRPQQPQQTTSNPQPLLFQQAVRVPLTPAPFVHQISGATLEQKVQQQVQKQFQGNKQQLPLMSQQQKNISQLEQIQRPQLMQPVQLRLPTQQGQRQSSSQPSVQHGLEKQIQSQSLTHGQQMSGHRQPLLQQGQQLASAQSVQQLQQQQQQGQPQGQSVAAISTKQEQNTQPVQQLSVIQKASQHQQSHSQQPPRVPMLLQQQLQQEKALQSTPLQLPPQTQLVQQIAQPQSQQLPSQAQPVQQTAQPQSLQAELAQQIAQPHSQSMLPQHRQQLLQQSTQQQLHQSTQKLLQQQKPQDTTASRSPQSLLNQGNQSTDRHQAALPNHPSQNGTRLQGVTGVGSVTQNQDIKNQIPQTAVWQAAFRNPVPQNQRLLTIAGAGSSNQLNQLQSNQTIRNPAQNISAPVVQGLNYKGYATEETKQNVGVTSTESPNLSQETSIKAASLGLKVNIGQAKLGQPNEVSTISGHVSPSQVNTNIFPISPTGLGYNQRLQSQRQYPSLQQHMLGLRPVQNVSEISNKFNQRQTNPENSP